MKKEHLTGIIAHFFIDDSTVSSNVPVFVLSDDDRAMATSSLPNGIRRSCHGCDNANNCTIFPIFLSVSINRLYKLVTIPDYGQFQNIFTVASRRSDLSS